MSSIRRTGDWALARRLMGTLPMDVHRAIDNVMEEESAGFLKKAQKAFDTSGVSNKKKWAPLKESSKAGRNGVKPLVSTGALKKSMHIKKKGFGEYLVDFKGGGGVSSRDMRKRAMTHEKGAVFAQRVTAGQFRAVMAKMANSGKSGGKGKGTFRPGAVVVVRIPARSFLSSTKEAHFSGTRYKTKVVGKLRIKLVKYSRMF